MSKIDFCSDLGLTTRKCRLADHDFVYHLVLQLKPYVEKFTEWNKKFFDDDFKRTYKSGVILLKGKRRIGMFQLENKLSHIYVTRIYLSPAYQGKGIGSAVMSYVESVAKAKRKRRIRLHIWQGNPALKFYGKLGYKVLERKDNKILMEKRL